MSLKKWLNEFDVNSENLGDWLDNIDCEIESIKKDISKNICRKNLLLEELILAHAKKRYLQLEIEKK